MKKKFLVIFILAILVFSNVFIVYADEKSKLKNQQSDIDKKIEETNSEIAGVKSQMTVALNQINNYNSQIGSFENEIEDLTTQINVLTSQINEKQVSIDEQIEKYNEQQELLNKRLVAMYESGSTSYLDMLLSSANLADLISKYYIIEQLAEYDTELLNNIEQTRLQIEKEKSDLENTKSTVETSKSKLEAKRNSLTILVNEKNALVGTLSAEEKVLENELEQIEQDKRDIQAKLAAIAAREEAERKAAAAAAAAKNGTANTIIEPSSPSTAGFICPIPGKSKGNITTGYYGYSGHTGVDFACGSGTSVVAAKGGTVVISTALRSSSGGYRSYGEYIVISHGDGTSTLYAHMLPGSRTVSEGTSVSQGQVIGQVGSTGNSTGPHLHFEVRINGRCVNPTAYLP